MSKIRKNLFLLLIPVMMLLVRNADAGFRFRSATGRSDDYQQYRNNYYKGSVASNVAAQVSSRRHTSTTDDESGKPGTGDQSKAKNISAWGIIAIVIGVIVLGTGGYYVFIFYPYLCKKERDYDMIELTNVL